MLRSARRAISGLAATDASRAIDRSVRLDDSGRCCGVRLEAVAPHVDHLDRLAGRFVRDLVAENLGEQAVYHGVESFFAEAVRGRFGLPDAQVAETAVGPLHRHVHDEPFGRLGAEALGDAGVERGIDRHILGEGERHDSFSSALIRMIFGYNIAAMADTVKPRPYDASARRARSTETRQRIVDAARALLLERGYRATTVAAIARAASVSVDTVYELVGRKPTLLREVIEQAISGTDRAVAADDRAYVQAMRAERDPGRKLEIYAGAIRAIHARMAPLVLALRDASTTEPEAHEVWQEITTRRAANMRRLARELRDAGGLRPDLTTDDAGDILWATNSAELYVLLVDERGWAPAKYEQWLADTWHRVLL